MDMSTGGGGSGTTGESCEVKAAWALGFGEPDVAEESQMDAGQDIAVDAQGNVFVTGWFYDTIDFGGGALQSNGGKDIFVASFGPDGAHRWSRSYGVEGSDMTGRLALTSGGDLVVGGSGFSASLFDNVQGNGFRYGYVFRLGADGEELDSVTLESSKSSRVLDVAVDADDNIYAVGGFYGDLLVDGIQPSAGDEDQFVVKLNSSLETVWSWTNGDEERDLARAVAVSSAGDVAVTGYFSTLEMQDAEQSRVDVYLAMFGQSNTPKWERVYQSELGFMDKGHELEFLSGGDLIVTGFFSDELDFGQGAMVSAGDRDAFLARLDGEGTEVWAKSFGGPGLDISHTLVVDEADNITIGGRFYEKLSFGGAELEAAAQDLFVATFTDQGDHLWSTSYGGEGHDQAGAVARDADGNTYLTGWFRGTLAWGGDPLLAAYRAEVLVMKRDSCDEG
jgi:hypothetical protein